MLVLYHKSNKKRSCRKLVGNVFKLTSGTNPVRRKKIDVRLEMTLVAVHTPLVTSSGRKSGYFQDATKVIVPPASLAPS
jgi:hypothetical protein